MKMNKSKIKVTEFEKTERMAFSLNNFEGNFRQITPHLFESNNHHHNPLAYEILDEPAANPRYRGLTMKDAVITTLVLGKSKAPAHPD